MPHGYLLEGLYPSLCAAGVLALLFVLITARRAAYNLREMDELTVLCGLGVSAFSSLCCVFYPLANLYTLARQNPDLWSWILHADLHGAAIAEELKEGVLALRVTSVAVGLNATRSLIEALRLDPLPTDKASVKQLFSYKEAEQVDANALPVFRNRFAQNTINLVQAGFYELNILLLCSIKFWDRDSTTAIGPALLAWALFYIIDDWRIIFRFSLALKGRFMREHFRQIRNTNWIIALAGAWCAYRWSIFALVAYLACCILLHRLILYVGYGIRGNWKIPGALDWKFFDQKMNHETGERNKQPALTATPSQPLTNDPVTQSSDPTAQREN
jgi:hypothetical protein